MEKVTFSVPAMWADHHVLAVREALGQVSGVEDVLASAMYKDVLVKYDPSTTNPDATEKALRPVLPEDLWIDINDLLVTFGQNQCHPTSPRCSTCPLDDLCPRIGVVRHR